MLEVATSVYKCTQLYINIVPVPGHAIPCHARIESRSAQPHTVRPNLPARAVMVLVLDLVAAPHESLATPEWDWTPGRAAPWLWTAGGGVQGPSAGPEKCTNGARERGADSSFDL